MEDAPSEERMARERIVKFVSHLSFSRTVLAALGSRFWQIISGPVTVFLIAKFFNEAEQGVFYAFSGYLGIQAFFELGLSGVLISVAGHENFIPGEVTTEEENAERERIRKGKLADLLIKAVRFYLVAGAGFLLVTGVSGYLFFQRQQLEISWGIPWGVLVIFATSSFVMTPLFAILEGTGKARLVYFGRLWQAVIGSLAVWAAIVSGAGLWTAVASSVVQTSVQLAILFGPASQHLRTILRNRNDRIAIEWNRIVLPMQWRIALQGIALYLSTQAFTLVLMDGQSTEVAGRWGISSTVLFALQAMAMSWVMACYPQATEMAATGNWRSLNRYWLRVAGSSAALLVFGILSFSIVLWGLDFTKWTLQDRFVAPSNVAIFGVGMVAYHIAATLSYYVRAQRRESLYMAAVLGQLCVAATSWYAASTFGTEAMCWAYALSNALILLPLHLIAFWIDQSTDA